MEHIVTQKKWKKNLKFLHSWLLKIRSNESHLLTWNWFSLHVDFLLATLHSFLQFFSSLSLFCRSTQEFMRSESTQTNFLYPCRQFDDILYPCGWFSSSGVMLWIVLLSSLFGWSLIVWFVWLEFQIPNITWFRVHFFIFSTKDYLVDWRD